MRGMVSSHSGPAAAPYHGMTDEEVLEVAKAALTRAEKARASTRKVQLAIFDSAMSELARRAMAHVLWKIHERENGDLRIHRHQSSRARS